MSGKDKLARGFNEALPTIAAFFKFLPMAVAFLLRLPFEPLFVPSLQLMRQFLVPLRALPMSYLDSYEGLYRDPNSSPTALNQATKP